MKRFWQVGLLLMVIGVSATVAMAQERTNDANIVQNTQDNTKADADKPKGELSTAQGIAIIGACLGAGLCSIGGGYAIARIGGKCIEAIARQPEAAGAMFAPMIVTAAMVEGGMLFAIVVCLLGVLGR